MADTNDYNKTLSDALKARADWLEKSELPKLKDALRLFQMGYASLYNLYIKKGLIVEDPYKQEVKVGELEVPETGNFIEAKKHEQLGLRLSNYDTQMDFLVNFYQFSTDFLTLDRLKRIANMVKYIDWVHLTPDSGSPNTKEVADMTSQIKQGVDPLTMSVITESLSNLNKQFGPIMAQLKLLVDYRRELYKCELRENITSKMAPNEANQVAQIKKNFPKANMGQPFYPDLAEELIKEDYTGDGPALREKVLKSLKVAGEKPKAVKQPVSFKVTLLEGIQVLGTTAQTFSDVYNKVEENRAILESAKRGFLVKLKKIIHQMLNKEPEAVIYELDYLDQAKGVRTKEKVNISSFQTDLQRKINILTKMGRSGAGMTKLETMQDDQIISFLEKNIRDLQTLHKTLTALDEFFKTQVDKSDRERIKGIKPELGTIKNAIIRANSRRHEYSAQKEEEDQLRKLGVSPSPES